MRMIDADALMQDIEKYHLSDGKFQHWVEVQPTIEERKTGKWIGKYPVTSICSECGFLINDSKVRVFAFCPNCGADMRGNG